MKIKNFALKFLLLVIGLVMCASPFFATKTKDTTFAYNYDSGISINSVFISVNVCENGVLNVSQTFEVEFLRSGLSEVLIYVPYKGVIYREDEGKVAKTHYLATISNYSLELGEAGSEYLNFYHDEANASEFVTFGIKSPTGYSYGETKTFTLYYDYDMKNKGTAEFDEVYFNLLGYNSSMPVNNVSFEITFPKTVDFSTYTPAIYYGEAGATDQFLDFRVEGNKIISNNPISLEEYEALTLRQLLPKGYLVVEGESVLWPVVVLIVCVVLAGVIIAVKVIYRQKGEVVSPVEFTAPEGVSPDIAEFYDKLKVTDKSAGAIIIYLANLGYLSVVTDENHEPQKLRKLKDLPENFDPKIKRLFDAMFKNAEVVNSNSENSVKTDASLSDAKESVALNGKKDAKENPVSNENSYVQISIESLNNVDFYSAFNALKSSVAVTHGERLYVEKSKNAINIVSFLIPVAFALMFLGILIASISRLGFVASFVYSLIIPLVISVVAVLVSKKYNKLLVNILCIVLVMFFVIIVYVNNISLLDPYYLMVIGAGIVLATMLFNAKPQFSESAAKTRGSVLGLKNYIKLAEKDRLELLVKDNPNYYFDILPYAYVLDVSDVWMEKFKDIKIPSPVWLESNVNIDVFDVIILSGVFTSLNSSVLRSINSQAITHANSRSFAPSGRSIRIGGGGFSGGGFAGGGGGGGSFGAR